ncbi:Hsp20/alpha crystallin family protein [Variovorax guangxiensis]|uniref:Hsp20/alpha crystallin family protein n=1 Tax=Variovorax guangxiensis TaxID=1775474 RepID=UPI002866967F|nr:HSP20 family molecular chaperone IbpA [Variovorax guangxiensis]
MGRGGFPALNVGSTSQTVEIYAFAPGLDPAALDVQLDRGLLTVSGERPSSLPEERVSSTVHINERFAGSQRSPSPAGLRRGRAAFRVLGRSR